MGANESVLRKYKALTESFLSGAITAQEFKSSYLVAFKAEPGRLHPSVFRVLDKLFADLDAYDPDCLPGQETDFEISEQQLRTEASTALDEIDRLLSSGSQ